MTEEQKSLGEIAGQLHAYCQSDFSRQAPCCKRHQGVFVSVNEHVVGTDVLHVFIRLDDIKKIHLFRYAGEDSIRTDEKDQDSGYNRIAQVSSLEELAHMSKCLDSTARGSTSKLRGDIVATSGVASADLAKRCADLREFFRRSHARPADPSLVRFCKI